MRSEAPLSLEATARAQALDLPLSHPVPAQERVIRIRPDVDWEAFQPPRATTLRWKIGRAVKRAIDIVGAGVGLILLILVFAVIAVAIKLTSPS